MHAGLKTTNLPPLVHGSGRKSGKNSLGRRKCVPRTVPVSSGGPEIPRTSSGRLVKTRSAGCISTGYVRTFYRVLLGRFRLRLAEKDLVKNTLALNRIHGGRGTVLLLRENHPCPLLLHQGAGYVLGRVYARAQKTAARTDFPLRSWYTSSVPFAPAIP
jgi:hypothetical protein